MRVVMVKGFSKTGKTSTVTSLVRELRKRGYTVGTVKDIHFEGYKADMPGTDTFKHREAGARRVTALGNSDTAIIADRHMTIHEILKYYKEDYVILEGDCGLKCPTIITGKTIDDIDKRMCPEAIAISGIIAGDVTAGADGSAETNGTSGGAGANGSAEPRITEYNGLPVINGITEVEKLADIIGKNTERMVEDMEVELSIGGEDVWMVPFVKETIKNVVVGAVKALDGYEEGKEIIIKVK